MVHRCLPSTKHTTLTLLLVQAHAKLEISLRIRSDTAIRTIFWLPATWLLDWKRNISNPINPRWIAHRSLFSCIECHNGETMIFEPGYGFRAFVLWFINFRSLSQFPPRQEIVVMIGCYHHPDQYIPQLSSYICNSKYCYAQCRINFVVLLNSRNSLSPVRESNIENHCECAVNGRGHLFVLPYTEWCRL
jgi:hypothetical protein